MSPYQIGILMHYHVSFDDYAGCEPLARPTLEEFVSQGLLRTIDGGNHRYEITPRGEVYCQALQLVPLPRSQWVVDWPGQSL